MLSGCSGDVELDAPEPTGADATACEKLLDGLPDTLADQDRRDVTPTDAFGAAWGDPAITLTCGVDTPPGFNRASQCEVADGVGWYVPPEQYDDQTSDATLTAVGYRPLVQVDVPGDYRPSGPAAAIAQLSTLVKDNLTFKQRCR